MNPAGIQRGSEEPASASAVLRHLDLILLALALPLFVAADWPLLGYAVAAGAWLAQRLVLAYASARAARSIAAGNRRDAFQTTAISGLGRAWFVSLAALLAGLLAGREVGLAAALLITVLFTVQLATSTVGQREREEV